MNAIELDWVDLAAAGTLIAVNALISIAFRLGMERTLAIAAVRSVVQLLAVGYVLEAVFELSAVWAVVPLMVAMCLLAAQAAVKRTSRQYPGMYSGALLAMGLSAGSTLMFALLVVIGVDPWWNPRYAIPILGMILGNSLTGISLALDRFVAGLWERRGEVELHLSHGATPREAVRRIRAEAVRVGMIPIINTMMVVGTVSLPGMMTGQILSGTPPREAVAYQIVIIFVLAAATASGSVTAVLLAERRLFGHGERLLAERITRSR
ncbi:MAG: putative ABC transport system permease protein [Myxococcota bacterium]|jgi:putative ABC transport system permease protein